MTVISKSSEKDITPDEDPDITAKRQAIKIREMEIDDLAVVFHLGETLFKSTEVPNLYRTWDPYEVTGMFNDDTEYCLVAEAGRRIAGFALGTTITKSHSAWKYGYLIWLGVAPEFQRMGVAEKLLHRFRDLMIKDGARMLLADTQADNRPAIRFFEKNGFGNSEEHIYLSLNLDPERQRLKKKRKSSAAREKSTGSHASHAQKAAKPAEKPHG
ncbi:MAG: GNAT family N-acetyltransferase [Thermodesulfobacteriota bacterium]